LRGHARWKTLSPSTMTIRQKLTVSHILVVLVCLLLFFAVSNYLVSSIVINRTIHNALQNTEVIRQAMESQFRHAENLSTIIAANDTVQDILRSLDNRDELGSYVGRLELRAALDNIIEPRTSVSSVIIFPQDRNTRPVGTSQVRTERIEDYPEWDENRSHGTPIWEPTKPFSFQISYAPLDAVSLTRPVYDISNGRLSALVQIHMFEPLISRLYADIKYGETGRFFIVDSKGIVMSSKERAEIYTDLSGEAYMDWALSHQHDGRLFEMEGKRMLITTQQVKGMNWHIIGKVPVEELTRDSRRVTLLLVSAGAFCVLLAILLSFLLSRSISRPITGLSRAMANAGKGDLKVQMEVKGQDEVAFLSRSFNKMIGQISLLMDSVYTEQQRKREYELIALQAQINPHFLYNTLENVSALAKLERSEDVFLMVKALSRFYRIALSKGSSLISVREELDLVKDYVTIQQIRYRDQFDFYVDMEEELLQMTIVKLTLQPLVENAIYHGLRKKRGRGRIDIRGERSGDSLMIAVTDNGVGMKDAGMLLQAVPESRPRSFGVRSVDERIKLSFGPMYGLTIQSVPGEGTTLFMRMPAIRVAEGGTELAYEADDH